MTLENNNYSDAIRTRICLNEDRPILSNHCGTAALGAINMSPVRAICKQTERD